MNILDKKNRAIKSIQIRWFSCLSIWLLISAQVSISAAWVQALCWAAHQAWSLLLKKSIQIRKKLYSSLFILPSFPPRDNYYPERDDYHSHALLYPFTPYDSFPKQNTILLFMMSLHTHTHTHTHTTQEVSLSSLLI